MTSTRYRQRSQISATTIDSIDSDGALYPENILSASTETRGTLWRQYSLIEKSLKVTKPGICCGNDRQRPWLLRGSFLFVTGLGLLVGALALRFSVYSPKQITITGGDQLLLPTSTFINKELLVQSLNQNQSKYLQLHILKEKPQISKQTYPFESAGIFYLASWTYEYWGLHLLKGTTLKISICSDLHLQFYIIKGDKKLKQWTQETLFTSWDFHVSIHPKSNCKQKENFLSHLLTISQSDTYYLFFTTSVGWRFLTQITVALSMNRTYYDLSDTLYSCSLNNASCYTNLSYASNDITLLHAVQNNSQTYPSPFDRIKIRYIPLPRWSFYIKLFGSIYVSFIILTIVYTIYRCIVNYFSCGSEETQPLLVKQQAYQRAYSYSLHSAAGGNRRKRDKNAWLVISPVATDKKSKKFTFETRERDNESVLSDIEHEHIRRETLLDDLSVSSRESNFLKSRTDSQYNANMRQTQQMMEDQRLLDSVMTSAGVSAI